MSGSRCRARRAVAPTARGHHPLPCAWLHRLRRPRSSRRVDERECVSVGAWLPRDAFLDLLGVANLIPGPTSTELAMHIGRVHAGWPAGRGRASRSSSGRVPRRRAGGGLRARRRSSRGPRRLHLHPAGGPHHHPAGVPPLARRAIRSAPMAMVAIAVALLALAGFRVAILLLRRCRAPGVGRSRRPP